MRKKLFVFLILLLASNDIAYGKHGNKTSTQKNRKPHKSLNQRNDRTKRSSSIKAFYQHLPNEDNVITHKLIDNFKPEVVDDDAPFWGARGRRESSSAESSGETLVTHDRYCSVSSKMCFILNPISNKNDFPFWGNRGRRDDSKSAENSIDSWENRVTRQDERDEPFWGSRGRRNDDIPFWGNRGRRFVMDYYTPSKSFAWLNDDTTLSANTGRRRMSDFKAMLRDEPEPFWGNRGKKAKIVLLDDEEPFWANRGKREKSLNDNVNPVISDEDRHSESIKAKGIKTATPFWSNRGRDSKLKYLFSGIIRDRMKPNVVNKEVSLGYHIKPAEQNTIQDDRMFAEEPRYILIERNSRSSLEEDPYIITRGKKYANHIVKAIRDRRGALEDIVKSVQKDPYYISRGKKDSYDIGKTISLENLLKNKEMICGLLQSRLKNEGNKIKRDGNDSERDRRTILKKIAAQLQEDPYFVSRGKKEAVIGDDKMHALVNVIAEMCS